MVLEDVGILEEWRKLWPALVADWKQYGVYALARIFLGIVAGVLAGLGFVVIGIVLAIPFGIIAITVYLVFEVLLGMLTVAIASLIGLGVLYLLLVFIAGITFVQVPIQTYLRYYSLFVLGSVTPPFDMVAHSVRWKPMLTRRANLTSPNLLIQKTRELVISIRELDSAAK